MIALSPLHGLVMWPLALWSAAPTIAGMHSQDAEERVAVFQGGLTFQEHPTAWIITLAVVYCLIVSVKAANRIGEAEERVAERDQVSASALRIYECIRDAPPVKYKDWETPLKQMLFELREDLHNTGIRLSDIERFVEDHSEAERSGNLSEAHGTAVSALQQLRACGFIGAVPDLRSGSEPITPDGQEAWIILRERFRSSE